MVMQFELKPCSLEKLAKTWLNRGLSRNPEYQRGETWTLQQKQALIDSILRDYPIPSFFFEERETESFEESPTKKWEIVDGQQRIIAIADFVAGKFKLLSPKDPKLRLPKTMRGTAVSWADKTFDQLEKDDRERLLRTQLNVYFVRGVNERDQIRDLFIRLQSGTALTRQQVRDAWPGDLGPQIEKWAGKFDKQPTIKLFDYVDRRSTRDDEGDSKDPFVKHRTTCAQVVTILLNRNHWHVPSVGAGVLDATYHENTDFGSDANSVKAIEDILRACEATCSSLGEIGCGKKKLSKQCLFALAMFFQDISTNKNFSPDHKALGRYISGGAPNATGKSTTGASIQRYYIMWIESLPGRVGLQRDPNRFFNEKQKEEMLKLQNGLCAICDLELDIGDSEGDHHPTPWYMGGKTEVANGRMVHKTCHPRGRPSQNIGE